MKMLSAAFVALALGAGVAQAATYQLTYTGNRLRPQPDGPPLVGAKHLSFVLQSVTPFPKNSCFNLPLTDMAMFTDGVDTPSSLAAAGYSVDSGSYISLCSNALGNKITSWRIDYGYEKPSSSKGLKNGFGMFSSLPNGGTTPPIDNAVFELVRGKHYVSHKNLNTSMPGKWKFQTLN